MATPGRESIQWVLSMAYAATTLFVVYTVETSDHELSWVGAIVMLAVLLMLMKRTDTIVTIVQYVYGDGED